MKKLLEKFKDLLLKIKDLFVNLFKKIKNFAVNHKTKFTVIFLSVFIVIVTIIGVLVITLVKDYDIKSIKVNGTYATIGENTAIVSIEQAETVDIVVETNSNLQIRLFKDKTFTQNIENFYNIQINGIDTTFYITIGNDNNIKKIYELTIKNVIQTKNELCFKINGVTPNLINNEYQVTLPDITETFFITPVSPFYSYSFYFDATHKNKIENITNFTFPSGETVIYVDLTNINQNDISKSYKINILLEQTKNGIIDEIFVNETKGNIVRTNINVYIERSNILSIKINTRTNTTYKVYKDITLNSEIKNSNRITDLDLTAKSVKFYINVISNNETSLIYTLNIYYLLNDDTDIKSLTINNTYASIDDTGISVLIERTKSLNIKAECNSRKAKIEFYNDKDKHNKIINTDNIDVSEHLESVYQIFAYVTAENGTEKYYPLFVNFVKNDKADLLDLKANNQTAKIDNDSASLEYIGTPDSFIFVIENIKVSDYAKVVIYNDVNCTSPINYENGINLVSNHQTFYIKITAENGTINLIPLTVNLISNDNEIKSITVNNQEFIIKEESSLLLVEHATTISIDNIKYDPNADIAYYYDELQTNLIEDISNIVISNNTCKFYIRVVAETGDIKVFTIEVNIKNAPTPAFIANEIHLVEWQKTIPLSQLFYFENNSYNESQYSYEVYWDNKKQNTEYISVSNNKKIYELKLIINSPYFSDVVYNRSIHILPYVLTNVTASLNYDLLETKDTTTQLSISDLIILNTGSYIIGRDFYIEVYGPTASKQILIDLNGTLNVFIGLNSFYITSFNNYFDSFQFGELNVKQLEKEIPTINANEFTELEVSSTSILIKDLFEIIANDYEINLIKTFCNNQEIETFQCDAGIYLLKLQVLYAEGIIEKEIKVEVSNISNNTSIDLYVNEKLLIFNDNEITLPELNFNEPLNLTAKNYNSKAKIQLNVNGFDSEFGEISLKIGLNTLTVTVIAENGNSEVYKILITKKSRLLPTINAPAQTIKLTKNQTEIDLSDLYSIKLNDYLAKLNIYYDNNEIRNNILEIENTNKIYEIVLTLTGEFGTISEILEIGLIPYTAIEVKFNTSTLVHEDENYIFSQSDFIDEIIYYGIDSSLCTYKLYCNGEPFNQSTLNAGEYYITIEIWQSNILYHEDANIFIISFYENTNAIKVALKSSEFIIPEKSYIANLNEIFEIDFGTYNLDDLIIRFIYNETNTSQNILTLVKGKNYVALQIIELLTEKELFIKDYTITCTYTANSDQIFSEIQINGITQSIINNDIILIHSSPLNSISLTYNENDEFTVFNFPNEIILDLGLNTIQFYTEETDGSSYIATLNIYNLCSLDYFIISINYEGESVNNDNKIILPADCLLNTENFIVNLNSAEHIKITTNIVNLNTNIFDITFSGKFDDIDIGTYIVRAYIGTEQPRLTDLIAKITGEDIVDYSINEYNLEVYLKSNLTQLDINVLFVKNNYTLISTSFSNLNYGFNERSFIIKQDSVLEYQYNINIILLPLNLLESVSYDNVLITANNNYYITSETDNISRSLIAVVLKDIGIKLNLYYSDIYFNDILIGTKIDINFNGITVQTIYVTIPNNNSSINCSRDEIGLTQLGNNTFKDTLTLRKSNSSKQITVNYFFDCVYPLTFIADERFVYDKNLGYLLKVDLTSLLNNDAGTYNHQIFFDVFTVSSKLTFTLDILVEIYEVTADNAVMTVNINNNISVYFNEDDMLGYNITANDEVALDIFTTNVVITIKNELGCNLYDNGILVNSVITSPYFNGDKYVLQFYIGQNEYNLKPVIIYITPYTDNNGNSIETAITYNEQQIYILKNAQSMNIQYNGETYSILTSNKSLLVLQDTTEVLVDIYGHLADDFGFAFKNGTAGKSGLLEIKSNKIILLITDGTTIIPYAIINVEFV